MSFRSTGYWHPASPGSASPASARRGSEVSVSPLGYALFTSPEVRWSCCRPRYLCTSIDGPHPLIHGVIVARAAGLHAGTCGGRGGEAFARCTSCEAEPFLFVCSRPRGACGMSAAPSYRAVLSSSAVLHSLAPSSSHAILASFTLPRGLQSDPGSPSE